MNEPNGPNPEIEKSLAKYSEMLQSGGRAAAERYRLEESGWKDDIEFRELAGTMSELAASYAARRKRRQVLLGGLILGALFLGLVVPYIMIRVANSNRERTDLVLESSYEQLADELVRQRYALMGLTKSATGHGISQQDEVSLGPAGEGEGILKQVRAFAFDSNAAALLAESSDSFIRGHARFRQAREDGRYADATVEALRLVLTHRSNPIAWYDAAKATEYDLDRKRRSPEEMEAAIGAYQQVMAIGFGSENLNWEIRTRNNLAWVHYEREEFDQAEEIAAPLPELMKRADALGAISYTKTVICDTLADIALARGNAAGAIGHLRLALRAAVNDKEKGAIQKKIDGIESAKRKN